ncbi:hypothetical protein GCM10023093_08030 [Nemorincola caseinilytica]|uniref:Uncharacterized protein n=1 Tax=Nemorincola caseinilytica TaxID=2054315 RepID=A0ABP8N9D5_9BACT
MRYTAKGKYGKSIELTDDKAALLGSVRRASWRAIRGAIISVGGTEYTVAPRGVFNRTVDVTKDGQQLISCTFKPMGKVVITTANGTSYTLKRTNFFRGHYGLFSSQDQQIVTIVPHFKLWFFGITYDIDTDDNYTEGRDTLLLLLLVYAINTMQRAAAAAAT